MLTWILILRILIIIGIVGVLIIAIEERDKDYLPFLVISTIWVLFLWLHQGPAWWALAILILGYVSMCIAWSYIYVSFGGVFIGVILIILIPGLGVMEYQNITTASVINVEASAFGSVVEMDNGELIQVKDLKVRKGYILKYRKTLKKVDDITVAAAKIHWKEKEIERKAGKITDIYVDDESTTLFVSDGGYIRVRRGRVLYQRGDEKNSFSLKDSHAAATKAISGDSVIAVLDEASEKFLYYKIILPEDYSVEKTVSKIIKYYGGERISEGKLSLNSVFLSGSQGSGEIKEVGEFGEAFYINIFFTDGSVNMVKVNTNPIWRVMDVGSIVVEKRIDGELMLIPTYRVNEGYHPE